MLTKPYTGIDGKTYTQADFADARVLAILFTCNHCPASVAASDRIEAIHQDFKDQGVALVAVNPNHPESLRPDELGHSPYNDSFEEMAPFAADLNWTFPYLYDGETQEFARACGAQATPHVFVFDAEHAANCSAASMRNKPVQGINRFCIHGATDRRIHSAPQTPEQKLPLSCDAERQGRDRFCARWAPCRLRCAIRSRRYSGRGIPGGPCAWGVNEHAHPHGTIRISCARTPRRCVPALESAGTDLPNRIKKIQEFGIWCVILDETTMKTKSSQLAAAFAVFTACTGIALGDAKQAAQSINEFGLDLHRKIDGNAVNSPWSLQSALGMTYAGAAGQTHDEMRKSLRFPEDEATLHNGLAAIAADLEAMAEASRERIADPDRRGGPNSAIDIRLANRLFGQEGYPFIEDFLTLTRETYAAPLQPMNFEKAPDPSRIKINKWVAGQTHDRITDLIPTGLIDEDTRMVLANAVYLLAPWAQEFSTESEAPFFVDGNEEVRVDGLHKTARFGYMEIPGGTLVSVPYDGRGLSFLLMVPDERDGLADFEASLTAEILASAAEMPTVNMKLHFPKFKIEPPSTPLKDHLIAMGMPTAFDQPRGSADFSRMAPRKPNDYLCISEVVHRAFIAVDQYGTEAAAATAVIMMRRSSLVVRDEPLEVRIDRPFTFAVQHKASGACLFLGRVTDPR